jgi:hypothetical protein
VSDKKKFLLRLNEQLFASLEKWASDDMRSVNAQIEYLLADAVKRSGRMKQGGRDGAAADSADTSGNPGPSGKETADGN